jgi:para-nitrobenzyl esterase
MKQSARLAALLIAGIAASAVSAEPAAVLARVDAGVLRGESADGISIYKGVPYAAPPVGRLRWEAPQAVVPWRGVRIAANFGAACPQDPKLGGNPQPQSEDCLYLNVWAPAAPPRGGAPVMVWLHGGGYVAGAGFQSLYDGTAFARDGVVLVSINYRLGALGFFAHPALHRAGNFGLMDQIAALRWVKRNVAAFGGDPRRVTLFGESAGGFSVLALLAAPPARGLFAGAIAESAPGFRLPKTLEAQRAKDLSLVAAAGLPQDVSIDALRALPPEQLRGEHADVGPFIDGTLVAEFPLDAFRSGRDAALPLMLGTNSDEGSIAYLYPAGVARLLSGLGNHADAVREAYSAGAPDQSSFERQLFADAIFGASIRRIALLHARRAPTYLYRFDYLSAAQRGQRPGTGHAGELVYVFDTLDRWKAPATAEDRAMAALVHRCWVSFAKGGHPECGHGATWPAVETSNDYTFVFAADRVGTVQDYRRVQFMAVEEALFPRTSSAR